MSQTPQKPESPGGDAAAAGANGRFIFPPWSNYLLPVLVILVIFAAAYLPVLLVLGLDPRTTDVGYAPDQPVEFSHALHVGQLGLDCRTCHSNVEDSSFAALPTTQTCMSCHTNIRADSPMLEAVRDSYETGEPLAWRKVHDLPDHAYFDHAAHVNKGIGCVTCHGPVDQMEKMYQHEPMSMAWCLECHRNPERHIRPREEVFNMDWDPQRDAGRSQEQLGRELLKEYGVESRYSMESCSRCHR